MRYRILDPNATLPTRKHPIDAGMDVYSLGNYVIKPQTLKIVRTGIGIETPPRYMTLIKPKSSSNFLIGGGVIDEGYSGEVFIKIFNVLSDDVIIRKGDAVAQLINVKIVANPPDITSMPVFSDRGDDGGIGNQVIPSDLPDLSKLPDVVLD